MSKVGCKVTQDLLPLYMDDIVSDETKELVEEHVRECEACRQELDMLKAVRENDIKLVEDYVDENVIRSLKKKIRKKQIVIATFAIVAAVVMTLGGMKLYLNMTRPDLNGNEKIASEELTPDGTPLKVLQNTPNSLEICKSMGKVYISMPVNNKKMEQCHIELVKDGQKLEDKVVSISDARYATYCLDNLEEMESGLYDFIFYDSNDNICQYVWFSVEE